MVHLRVPLHSPIDEVYPRFSKDFNSHSSDIRHMYLPHILQDSTSIIFHLHPPMAFLARQELQKAQCNGGVCGPGTLQTAAWTHGSHWVTMTWTLH